MRTMFWESIQKALTHKYLSKRKGKNGKWIYVYADGSRHGDHSVAGHKLDVKDEHIHEGASFSAGSGKGHYVVKSAKDGKVTFHHDEDGKEHTMSHEEFKAHVKEAHKDAARKHAHEGLQKRQDILERAQKHGSDKHRERAQKELARWKEQHKEHFESEGHGIFTKDSPLEEKLPAYMKAMSDVGKEADHAKAMALYGKLSQAQKDIKDAHGMDLPLPPKPESAKEKASRLEQAKKAEQEKARQEAERLDQIAKSPDGWKEHLRDKGIDPDHPYLKQHAEKAQALWDTWGIALQPPDRPFESNEEHEKLWATMHRDMDQFMGAVDMQQMRDRVARSGLSFSLEKDIPLQKERAEAVGFDSAAGVYRSLTKKLEVTQANGKEQHTFLHEFAHAMDHLSGNGGGFLSQSSPELKKQLDALPQAHLPTSLSPEKAGYYKSDVERVARAMEQFLPLLSMSSSALGLSKQSGYYTHQQLRHYADTFARIAKQIGIPIKHEAMEHFYNEDKFSTSMEIKQSLDLGETTKHIANKEKGHEWATRAHEYLKEGKHTHAIVAIERAKKEYGKGDDNPWISAHELATEAHDPAAWERRAAMDEMAHDFPEAKKLQKAKLPTKNKTKEGLTIPESARTTGALARQEKKLKKAKLPASKETRAT